MKKSDNTKLVQLCELKRRKRFESVVAETVSDVSVRRDIYKLKSEENHQFEGNGDDPMHLEMQRYSQAKESTPAEYQGENHRDETKLLSLEVKAGLHLWFIRSTVMTGHEFTSPIIQWS